MESDNQTEDPYVGAVLDGRFRLERLLGRGGMGTVYVAEQSSVDRRVAVKLIREVAAEDERLTKRFMREAKLLSSFNHPNLVRTIDFGRDSELGILYLVMELVDGVPIARLIDRGPLVPNFALEVVYQVCGALVEAHAEGVVHRDLKPDNMLVVGARDQSIHMKVLDFGIAHARHDSFELTETGAVAGTAAYMAPEQARSKEAAARSDLYSLGVVLFEILTGERPFTGDTPVSIMYQHVDEPPPPIRERFEPSAPFEEEVCELVEELLAKAPEDRPESALALRQRIEKMRSRTGTDIPSLANDGEDIRFDAFIRGDIAAHSTQAHSAQSTEEADEESVSPLESTALGFPPRELRAEREGRAVLAGGGASEKVPERRKSLIFAAALVLLVGGAGLGLSMFAEDSGSERQSTSTQNESADEPSKSDSDPDRTETAAAAANPTEEDRDEPNEETALDPIQMGVLYIDGEGDDPMIEEKSEALIEELTYGLSHRDEIIWIDRMGILDLLAEHGIDDPSAIEKVEAKACEVARQGNLDFTLVGDLEQFEGKWRLRSKLICTEDRSVVATFESQGATVAEVAETTIPQVVEWAREWPAQ